MCEKYVIIVKLKSNQNSLEKAPATTPPPKKTCLINPDDSTNFPQYPPFIGDRDESWKISSFNIFVSVDRYYNLAVNNGTDELRNITLEKVRIVKYCLSDYKVNL